jgi:predicted HTH transcriptional regulator
MGKLRIFVSSVQKELENERVAIAEVITTDPFLSAHCIPVLYEYEPASQDKALSGCLKCVDSCDTYIVLIWNEYGQIEKGLSITHHEYKRAKKNRLLILVYIKGSNEERRNENTKKKLLEEIREDGYKYKRFSNYKQLQMEVRASLVKLLKEQHGIEPSSDENVIAEQTIEAASKFGSRKTKAPWSNLNLDLTKELIAEAEKMSEDKLSDSMLKEVLLSRGMLWRDSNSGKEYATAAAVVLLADNPSIVFPHCRILADAFRGTEKTSRPSDQEDIHLPMPMAIEHAIEFVQRNTRHPMRVIGLNRVQLDEYPIEALRETLVNAVAHRRYELYGQKIFLTVFFDRVIVASPGLPPKPITLAKIRSGNYRPCSRNPLIAQNLSFFHRIEERGSGIGRMRDEMADHGLDPPRFGSNSGFFEIVLPGPADNLDRLRVSADRAGQLITPSIEAKLNHRQKQMVALLIQGEELTSRRCQKEFGITRDTANRDFKRLISLDLVEPKGMGRSRHYVLKGST